MQLVQEQLARVKIALHAFLESKRDEYPRFHYLSNDDLLHILYERQLENVAGVLVKCFNFESMRFRMVGNCITGVRIDDYGKMSKGQG